MRDMMAQIRDVGDGIRGGTYTMTAPVITGGSITGVALSGNTLTNPVITGGSINNTPIGASTANTGAFTTLSASSTATLNTLVSSSATITGGSVNNVPIGASTANTGAFTTLSASSTATLNTLASSGATLTGGSINNMAVGATTRSTGAFTTLASNGATTFTAGTASTSTTTGTAVITGGLGVSGRINAANFDGIVGANTAAAGNFTTLGATGVATFSAGTVSAPAITTTGDTNTGIFFPAADTIAFTEGGVESMRINSSGILGLGVTPSAWDTFNAFQMGGGSLAAFSNYNISLSSNAYFQAATGWKYVASTTAAQYELDGNIHKWYTAASGTANGTISWSERMRIDSSGNVVIGTTNTGYGVFAVYNASNSTIAVANSTSYSRLQQNAADLYINTNVGGAAGGNTIFRNGSGSTERMRLDSSGRLGLGVTPSAWATFGSVLQGNGYSIAGFNSAGNVQGLFYTNAFVDAGGTKYYSNGSASLLAQENGVFKFFNAPSGTAGNAITFTQAMTLDASGNLGIGTSSPSYKLSIFGTSYPEMRISNGTVQNQFYIDTADSYGAIGTATNHPFAFRTNGTERMRIHASGGVSIGNTTDRGAGNLNVTGVVLTGGYTVATLPAGVVGMRAYVTDALAPSFGVAVAGSGAVTIPVFYNGANWIVA
jgi:hypothetical protein